MTSDVPSRTKLSFVLDLMQDVTNGVVFIHSEGEIQRDLKPRNSTIPDFPKAYPCSLVLNQRAWKVAGFGVISALDPHNSVAFEFGFWLWNRRVSPGEVIRLEIDCWI